VTLRVLQLRAGELAPYAAGLGALEQAIRYPVDDGKDHFTIDHGPTYEPFFRGLGDPYYFIALDGDVVVGSFCGVARRVAFGDRAIPAAYGCDLKVLPTYRGKEVATKILMHAAVEGFRPRSWKKWHFAYGVAMRGDRGDVTRSPKTRRNAVAWLRPFARVAIYFAPPTALAALDLTSEPQATAHDVLDLSAETPLPDTVSTAGRKDLRLASTGAPWPLVHLPRGPSAWGGSFGTYLKRAGGSLGDRDVLACFAVDERRTEHVAWLASQGVTSGAVATIYAIRRKLGFPRAAWAHIATSEI
jgi:hypothetical protein